MDVITAFLNEGIDKEVYIKLPEGFNNNEDLVCMLSLIWPKTVTKTLEQQNKHLPDQEWIQMMHKRPMHILQARKKWNHIHQNMGR